MAQIILRVGQQIPTGATATVYPLSNWQPYQRPPVGTPLGASTTSAVVAADGTVTFTGLTVDTAYVAYASVGGRDVYIQFMLTAPRQVAGTGVIATDAVTATELAPGSLTAADADATLATAAALAAQLATVDGRWRTIISQAPTAFTAAITTAALHVVTSESRIRLPTTAAVSPARVIYLDPAAGEMGLTGRTTKVRLVVAAGVQDNAPVASFTFGLYPVGTPSGGTTVWNPNLGAVVAGSTVLFTTPAAGSKSAEVSSGEFTCPAAGWYCIGCDTSAGMAANSVVVFPMHLDVRGV